MPDLRSLVALAALTASCTEHPFVDTAMLTAYRPPSGAALARAIAAGTPYQLLAGDLHCHVTPPDAPWHVVRGPRETLALARREGLDFVVLTPHVPARFFEDPALRDAVLAAHDRLVAALDAAPHPGLIAVAGLEYTDYDAGHVGLAFADLRSVLDALPADEARRQPERFPILWSEHGGTIIVNHPLVTPVNAVVSIARADLSWRAWTQPDQPESAEVAAFGRLAQGFEAYNLAAAQLRDGVLRGGDDERTLRATLDRIDVEIREHSRRITPFGGSDSHSHHLRATTFVLATEPTADALRDALVAGRVCVRGPEACSLRVRAAASHGWSVPGADLDSTDGRIEARALGAEIELFADGAVFARPASDEVATVSLAPGRCHTVRAHVNGSWSAPVYVGCAASGRRTP